MTFYMEEKEQDDPSEYGKMENEIYYTGNVNESTSYI